MSDGKMIENVMNETTLVTIETSRKKSTIYKRREHEKVVSNNWFCCLMTEILESDFGKSQNYTILNLHYGHLGPIF